MCFGLNILISCAINDRFIYMWNTDMSDENSKPIQSFFIKNKNVPLIII